MPTTKTKLQSLSVVVTLVSGHLARTSSWLCGKTTKRAVNLSLTRRSMLAQLNKLCVNYIDNNILAVISNIFFYNFTICFTSLLGLEQPNRLINDDAHIANQSFWPPAQPPSWFIYFFKHFIFCLLFQFQLNRSIGYLAELDLIKVFGHHHDRHLKFLIFKFLIKFIIWIQLKFSKKCRLLNINLFVLFVAVFYCKDVL